MINPSEDLEEDAGDARIIQVEPRQAGERLDKTLADLMPDLSRARLQALIATGALSAGVIR